MSETTPPREPWPWPGAGCLPAAPLRFAAQAGHPTRSVVLKEPQACPWGSTAVGLRCLCGHAGFSPVFTYEAPPEGETRFALGAAQRYARQIVRCEVCGHFRSAHDMDLGALYAGHYVNATYGDDGIRHAFERIIGLPPRQSDNAGRVARVLAVARQQFNGQRAFSPSVLDVGSGLCVFLSRMKEAGWSCTALDPDPRAVEHARQRVGVEAICGDFMAAQELGTFDVVTFNKVLEHVRQPVPMLAKAKNHLRSGGFVYAELPDGEMAVHDGPAREEFFIEHWHIFSAASAALLAQQAGFAVQALERLREPSGKYTLRLFLSST